MDSLRTGPLGLVSSGDSMVRPEQIEVVNRWQGRRKLTELANLETVFAADPVPPNIHAGNFIVTQVLFELGVGNVFATGISAIEK